MAIPSDLTRAIAGALEASIKPVQPTHGRAVVLACRFCGKRSNPRGSVDAAVRDLDDHLAGHQEYADALLAAWGGDPASLLAALDAYAETE